MNSAKNNEKQKKNLKTSMVVFGVILVLILGIYFYLKNIMPSQMFNQGKKAMEAGQYEKALNLFNYVANARPYDTEPIYYQALAISKLPPTYENQKKLYEIAQLEDCDEASNLADTILSNMRGQIDKQIGPNYVDNVLYDDELIRWNNAEPITYSIFADGFVPEEYIASVKNAFLNWQSVSGGEINFKETDGNKNANICVNFLDDITLQDKTYNPNIIAKTIPAVKDDVLQRMDIYIKKGKSYSPEKMLAVAEHEVGHALGLGGHSSDPNDIMYYNRDYKDSAPSTDITLRDMNTLKLLYKMVPDVIDKPIDASQYNNLFYHGLLTTYPGENFELEIQRLISQIRRDGNDIVAWVDLAINYAYKKQYARSNFILNKVLPLVKNDFENQHVVLYNLAVNFYKMRNYNTSSRYLILAQDIKKDLDTQILETFIDVRLGKLNLAERKLKLLIEEYPDNIEIALKLAEVYHIKKEKQLEKDVIDNLLKRNPKAIRDRRVLKYKAKNNSKSLSATSRK